MKLSERFTAGITRYQPSDAADLAEFRLRTYGPGSRQVDAERSAWLDRNPLADPARPGLWVCRRDGRIVGQQAEIPFELQVGGQRHDAAWAVDLIVDPAWRLRGVGPALIATQLQEHGIVAGLNLSEKGFAAYQRTGWTDLGIVPVYARPLDVRRALDVVQVPARARQVAPVAAPILRAADAAAAAALRGAGVQLTEVEALDDRVDAVWAAASPRYRVLARRDQATLAWRIDERPDRGRLRRYLLARRGRPLGYAVLRPTARHGTGAMAVVDYLAPPRWVAPLLLAAGHAARRDGAAVLLVKTRNQPADRWLRAAGFLRREQGSDPPIRLMVHHGEALAGSPAATALSDPSSWFVTAADSDLEPATRAETEAPPPA